MSSLSRFTYIVALHRADGEMGHQAHVICIFEQWYRVSAAGDAVSAEKRMRERTQPSASPVFKTNELDTL